jgi:hypothetical protein
MHPYECGNPKCKAIASGWLSNERFPRACSTSVGCFACKQDSGRAKALGIRRRCPSAPTRLCRARLRSIVTKTALYTNWLAPGFNIDSRERVYSKRQSPNCPIKLSSQGCPECARANFNFQLFSSQSCKNPKLVKSTQI